MNVGMITCTYYMKIYGYKSPDPFNWGKMSQKWRDEFTYDDFLDLACEIHDIGFNAIEIWEPMFSWRKYSLDDAARVARDLHAIGFDDLAYCVGGLGAGDVDWVEPAYRFAQALGCKVCVGCLIKDDAPDRKSVV